MLSSRNQLLSILLLIGAVALTITLWPRETTTPLIIDETVGDAQIYFAADREAIAFTNDCVTVRWAVEGIEAVEFNSRPVIGSGEEEVCVYNAANYPVLNVYLRDTTQLHYTLPITVVSQHSYYLPMFILLWAALVFFGETFYQPRHKESLLRPLTIGVLTIPVLYTLFIVLFVNGASFTDFVPNYSDETYYWHQIATFKAVGFDGGYYTINEIPARAEFTHFYTKGPLFPMLYGSLGRIFGWEAHTGVYFNVALFTLALALFVYVTRPDTRQLIILSLMLATYWYLWRYLPVLMQEGLHSVLAVVFGAIFFIALRRPLSTPTLIATSLFIVIASFIRGVSWSVLLYPLFMIDVVQRRGWSIPHLAGMFVLATVLNGLAFLVFGQLSLPQSLLLSSLETGDGVSARLQILATNLSYLTTGFPAELIQRFQVFFVLFVAAGSTVYLLRRHRINKVRLLENSFHLLNLASIFTALMLFYSIYYWREYRIMAPHLLLSILLLIAFRRYWLVGILLVVNLLVPHTFLFGNYLYPQERVEQFRQAIGSYLVYDTATDNPWCNTLLLYNSNHLHPELMVVPAGIGISKVNFWETFELPPKSRYLLFPPVDDLRDPIAVALNVERLVITNIGYLYLNRDADCAPPSQVVETDS